MADETPAPLSAEEVDAIRARIDAWLAVSEPRDGGEWDMRLPVLGLLATIAARDAELATLREREAAEREIVAAVADEETIGSEDAAGHWLMCLVGPCDPQVSNGAYVHSPECLVTRARALLATSTPPADGATAQEGE